jgi:hypothetical protein
MVIFLGYFSEKIFNIVPLKNNSSLRAGRIAKRKMLRTNPLKVVASSSNFIDSDVFCSDIRSEFSILLRKPGNSSCSLVKDKKFMNGCIEMINKITSNITRISGTLFKEREATGFSYQK